MKKMKLFVSLISAAVIAASTVLGASAAHYKGDIDRNDDVTISDVVAIQMHLSGKRNLAKSRLIYADMNDDNKVNVFDLVLAKRVVLGSAPKSEVPSLTTPAVTTTVTTKTTTTTTKATTAATTKATTSATTKATTVATTKATTAATTVVTTKATTAATTVVTTKATTAATTAATTKPITTTPSQTTLVINAEKIIELDPTKELDKMTLTVDTSSNYKLVFLFGDNWNTYVDLYCNSGVLTAQYGTLIESVDIVDNEVVITFKSGLKVDSLTLYNNNSTITILDYTIKYVGDVAEPVETTVTTTIPTTTTTTQATTTTVGVTTPVLTTTEVTILTTPTTTEAEVTETTTTEAEVTETTTTTTTEAEVTETTTTTTTTATSISEEQEDTTTTTVTSNSDTAQTGVAGTDVNRAMLGFAYFEGYNYSSVNGDASYVGLEEKALVPEITGDGTYTARFTFDKAVRIDSQWIELALLGANGKNISIDNYPDLALSIDGFKVNGIETTKSLDSATITIGNWNPTKVNLVPLFETFEGITSFEVTFTITGLE